MIFRFIGLLFFLSWFVYGAVVYIYDLQAVITLIVLLCIVIFLVFDLKHQAKVRYESGFIYLKKPFRKEEIISISTLVSIENNRTYSSRAGHQIVKYKNEFNDIKMVFVDFDGYDLSRLLNDADKLGVDIKVNFTICGK